MSVAFDAVGPSSSGFTFSNTTSDPSPITHSWSHSCSGSNRLLLVGVVIGVPAGGAGDGAVTALTVTYNGVSMTSQGRVHSNASTTGFVELFSLINPATGSNTVLVTMTFTTGESFSFECGSISFTGVDQSTPLGTPVTATGSSSSASVNVSSATGNMVADLVGCGSSISSSGQTNRWLANFLTTSSAGNGAQSTAAGAGTVTMSYSVSADDWAIMGVSINAGSSGTTYNSKCMI